MAPGSQAERLGPGAVGCSPVWAGWEMPPAGQAAADAITRALAAGRREANNLASVYEARSQNATRDSSSQGILAQTRQHWQTQKGETCQHRVRELKNQPVRKLFFWFGHAGWDGEWVAPRRALGVFEAAQSEHGRPARADLSARTASAC